MRILDTLRAIGAGYLQGRDDHHEPRRPESDPCPTGTGQIEADDGTQLSYQVFGQGDTAPTVVLANGIGVSYRGLALQIAALAPRYRVLCWDYRGVGESRVASRHGDVSMARHATDLLAILDHLGIPRALMVGWSMGVQVALEVERQRPGVLRALVALLGSPGLPLHGSLPPLVAQLLARGFSALADRPFAAQALMDLAVALPDVALTVLRSVSFVGQQADAQIFAGNVRSVADADRSVYLRTLVELMMHDGSRMLSQLSCPVLVIGGGRDYITPTSVAREMAAAVPHGTYLEVPGGTHFALIEQPEIVNRWISTFAQRVFNGS